MIKEIINIELKDLSAGGLDIHIIKKYIVKTAGTESFLSSNLSILLIKSGRFKIKLKEIVQDLKAHDLLIIPKNSFCTIMEIENKLQLYIITFSAEFAFKNTLRKELVDSFYFIVRKEPLRINLDDKDYLVLSMIYKLIYFVNQDNKHNGSNSDLKRISFNLFLYELKIIYSRYTSGTLLNFSRKENLTIQFLTILSIHCRKQHQVKFYAGALFITPAYLSKIIKEITGKTAKDFINEAVIIEAKVLLEDLQLTIFEVSEELEFANVHNFSDFFKYHTSLSPSQYRLNSIENFKNL
ncbi:helix-turn-helix domain-containing protein [Flavobacterium anhuiense]|uniref:helix-turn-helix domain-containing protein n=1 Tax=Flavobacterium anhuiense TaxID=459526 RepID=UPI00118350F5|nr:helix-turn-helix domain-containing protein [Flavobacterium anhuiense]